MNAIPQAGNYAQVNGLKMYYEVHGAGEPLILLHGGFGMTGMFSEVLPLLAAGRQVIAADLQAHGRTADIDRPLRLEHMGDDVAALIRHLGFDKVDVMGFSMGGGGALRTAIQHPELVRKLVLISIPFKRDGWYPEIVVGMRQMNLAAETMKDTPMYQQLCEHRPGARALSSVMRQDERFAAPGLRLVRGGGRAEDAHAPGVRGRRRHPALTRRAVLRAAWRRAARRQLGWLGEVQLPAGDPARHNPLRYRRFHALAAAVTPFLDAPLPQEKS